MTDDPTPKRQQGMHETIANQLREDIIQGWRTPGSALGEADLATTFNTSRNSVREALRRLEAEGYVLSRRNRGAVVARPDPDEISGMLQIRGILEPYICRLAATHRSEEQFTQLSAIMRQAKEDLDNGDFRRLATLNSAFHLLIAEASGNNTAASIISQLLAKVTWTYGPAATIRGPHSWKEHADLLAAIERQDADAAETRMKNHICSAAEDFETRRSARTCIGTGKRY